MNHKEIIVKAVLSFQGETKNENYLSPFKRRKIKVLALKGLIHLSFQMSLAFRDLFTEDYWQKAEEEQRDLGEVSLIEL